MTTYKTLPGTYRQAGREFTITKRKGDIAFAECSDPSGGFEVFRVHRHDGREISGKRIEPAEFIPSANQWGSHGWSFLPSERDRAEAKFDELTKA